MQQINIVVLNPLFLGAFLGTGILAGACTVAAFFPWDALRSLLLLAAGVIYLVGSFFVTVVFNVPRNERLARMPSASPEAATYWPVYVREWLTWNHVRTAASLASAVCSGAALAY
jgi:uncharacterized membrane protein